LPEAGKPETNAVAELRRQSPKDFYSQRHPRMICLAAVAMLLLAETPMPEPARENLSRIFEQGNIDRARAIAFELVRDQGQRPGTEAGFAVDCANAALLHDYAGDYERAEALYL